MAKRKVIHRSIVEASKIGALHAIRLEILEMNQITEARKQGRDVIKLVYNDGDLLYLLMPKVMGAM